MASKARVTLWNAYWVGEDIYANVDGEPYLVDSGAEVSMRMPFGIWRGVVWHKGPYNLITTQDLKELNEPRRFRVNYLGFQVAADLGLSNGYREKLNQIRPPVLENDLQKLLGLCNYVRHHVLNYQKYAKPLYACLKKKGEDSKKKAPKKWIWTAPNQENLERLKTAIQDAIRLEPRSLTTRLVAEVSCEDNDAVVKVKNKGGGMVTLWSYTLSLVEKKFPQEEKELAVLARY
ncbi:hypothetical protein D5F01_LYC11073 [Larimichthys crocea]|uniref:Uncharacterized protein n=1 Tax=Larimichthys crocea TaxID=215358 RepID=A0A6G0IIX5_LARCR|nr:hypothetical protein D5F01_LYC11073 [Larimichthys crocea]